MAKKKSLASSALSPTADYGGLLADITSLLDAARRTSARAVNSVMTATYWEIGRRIVDVEQRGDQRAEYGMELIKRLATDLTARFGRGFSRANLEYMRRFYVLWQIPQTLSGESAACIPDVKSIGKSKKTQTVSGKLQSLSAKSQTSLLTSGDYSGPISVRFPLPWSHYVKLLAIEDANARQFYETEALRGGWSVRQLDRQIASQFYQRTLLSKNKSSMLHKGTQPQPDDLVKPARWLGRRWAWRNQQLLSKIEQTSCRKP